MKLIFLDFDGVLNCQDAYHQGFCNHFQGKGGFSYDQFYPPSKQLLNQLIEETDAKIIVSATSRCEGIDWLKKVWNHEKMAGEVIDITGHMGYFKPRNENDENYTIPRGCEIDYLLRSKGFRHINWNKDLQKEYMEDSGIENYIIIDDDSDMLYCQRNHFVHVFPAPRNTSGFNEGYYQEALEKLSKDVIELNYS